MLPEERRSRIAQRVADEGAVSVSELSRLFGVAEETIRRDLKALESAGALRRTHGGAVRVGGPALGGSNTSSAAYSGAALGSASFGGTPFGSRLLGGAPFRVAPVSERLSQNHELKEAIARAALELVQEGDTILLDSGSTTLELAKALAARRELVVVTHCLRIAAQLAETPHIAVNVLGGTLRPQELALVGPDTRRALERIRVDKAFMACAGFTLEQGAAVSDVLEAEVKRAMVDAAGQAFLLADHTKWGRISLASYASMDRFAAVITDEGLPEEARVHLRPLGVDIVIAR